MWLSIRIEDDDLARRHTELLTCCFDRLQQLWLHKDVLCFGCLERMTQLCWCICWVRAIKDTSCCYDAEKEQRIVQAIERVDANTVTLLNAKSIEACYKLADSLLRLPC